MISQSGALGAAMLDWMTMEKLGISRFVSYGNAADIDEADLLEYLMTDPYTKVIAVYLEGAKRPRKMAKIIARHPGEKPVIVLKAGQTKAGAEAAMSHTGSLAGACCDSTTSGSYAQRRKTRQNHCKG